MDHCILQRRYIIGIMARTDCQKTRISYPFENDIEIDRIASLCDAYLSYVMCEACMASHAGDNFRKTLW